MKKLFPFLLLLVLFSTISSCKKDDDDSDDEQTSGFCFSPVSSTSNYQSLSNPLNAEIINSSWGINKIDIGFNFNFCGKSFNEIYCMGEDAFATFTLDTSNGYTDLSEYEIHCYSSVQLSTDYHSSITYQVEGASGNKVCKIQYDSLYFDDWSAEQDGYASFQLWLYEKNNSIEIHYGPYDASSDSTAGIFGNYGPVVGVLGSSLSASIFASGDPQNCTASKTNANTLNKKPSSGTVIRFE